jgi:hypothetical protein
MRIVFAMLAYLGIISSLSWFGFVAYMLFVRLPKFTFVEVKPAVWLISLAAVAIFACSVAVLSLRRSA